MSRKKTPLPTLSPEHLGALAATMMESYTPPLAPGGSPVKNPARGPRGQGVPSPQRVRFTLDQFGTEDFFLRPSALGLLVRCPLRRVLELVLADPDEGGPAAQTGSLVHAAVAEFHKEPDAAKRVERALEALAASAPDFPRADPSEARLFLRHYVADPRNLYAECVAVELPVEVRLAPHPLDPTGRDIWIKGTLDQIRRENGVPRVWDVKTGAPSGSVMLGDHAIQLAAYVACARASGFPEAEPGGIIRVGGYRTREACLPSPDGVFFRSDFCVRDVSVLLDTVRLIVALIRSGEVAVGPGPHCSYCPVGGLDRCLPLAFDHLGMGG